MPHETVGVIAGGKGEPVRLETIIVPDPGPGEVLVRVQASGVCHTDLHYREGAITALEATATVEDMAFPGSGLHRLRGDMDGFWSVKVSGNWRVIFRFENGDAYDVDYLDYH